MKRFKFRLATVLKQRKEAEERMLRALGAAQRAHQEELQGKARLQNELGSALGRREALGVGRAAGVNDFQMEQLFIDGLKQRMIRADAAIMRAARGVEKAMRGYLGARRQTRMIEILEEKAREEFRREQAKKEQSILDDQIIMRMRLKEETA